MPRPRGGAFLAHLSRPVHKHPMPFPTMPDRAADLAHEEARRHPERETLELATAGAAQVLGVDHSVTQALARASPWIRWTCGTRGWGSRFSAGTSAKRLPRRGRTEGAGLSFRALSRSHAHMDPDLDNVIRQALGDALAAGKDHLSQTELAVRAVQRARPDMTASDALAAVNLVWRE